GRAAQGRPRSAGPRRVAERRGVRRPRRSAPMSGLTVRAAAKINLLLGVGARRPDGFHTLVTVYQAVSLYDDLTVTEADELTVTTEVASYLDASHLPAPGQNIIDRAAALLAQHHAGPVTAAFQVDKSIP